MIFYFHLYRTLYDDLTDTRVDDEILNKIKTSDATDSTVSDYGTFKEISNVSFKNGKSGTASYGSEAQPLNGGTVDINVMEYPNAIIELDAAGNTALTIQLTSISTASIGVKGSITIIERNPAGRSITTSPTMGITTSTTTPATNGGFSVDVIDYIILGANNIVGTYWNKL